MPLLDMPIEELKQYQGSTPRPEDFDAYWERGMAEMNAVDPQLSITENPIRIPGVRCYDMYFTGTKNSRIYAKLIKPEKIEGKCPAVLHFHGYGSRVGDWTDHASYAQMGFVIACLDVRGQTGKSEDKNIVQGNTVKGLVTRGICDPNPDNLYYRQVFLDTALLAKLVMAMEEVDENRVAVKGGSQGGALATVCAALCPDIKLASINYPFLSDYKRVWDMDLAKICYQDLELFFRQYDPLHERETEFFTKMGYIDVQNLAPRVKAKVLFAGGLQDQIVPPSTHYAVYNKIQSEKELMVYHDFGHENLKGFEDKEAMFLCQLLEK